MKEECIFCTIEEGATVQDSCNAHILDTSNFYVVAGRGQICDGYAIICTRQHMFNMSLLNHEQWEELKALKRELVKRVQKIYHCTPVFFEHGDADCRNRGGSCISHAHIHVVPVMLVEMPEMLRKFRLYQFKEEDEWKHFAVMHSPYFYLELSDGRIYMINEENLPCQFGRQILVKTLELSVNWDWRETLDENRMRETITRYDSIGSVK